METNEVAIAWVNHRKSFFQSLLFSQSNIIFDHWMVPLTWFHKEPLEEHPSKRTIELLLLQEEKQESNTAASGASF